MIAPATKENWKEQEDLDADRFRGPHLGVLTIASVLEQEGVETRAIDFDCLYAKWLGDGGRKAGRSFARHAAATLASEDAELFGFGTICSSYPLTLRTATLLRRSRPDARIVLGGPQATATAEQTMRAYPCVDVVVRGEGERVVSPLVAALNGRGDLEKVPGISYRLGSGIASTPDAPLPASLDDVPLPAFQLYPRIAECKTLSLEIGRGCPFSCTFCSTQKFFRRRYRLKSPDRILAQMREVRKRFGVSTFTLTHDNFAADRRRVVAFCEALLAARVRFTWTCSARTDCVDEELIHLMRRAGCRGIFFGIESGSPRLQRAMGKNLNLDEACEQLRHANRRRINSAAAFIVGFPDETADDLRKTVHLYVDSLRHDYVRPQITILSPLAGTEIHEAFKDELVFDGVISDIAFQGVSQPRADRQAIRTHPDVFSSFYAVPTRWLNRRYLFELRHFLTAGHRQLHWLLLGLHQVTGDILTVFDAWRTWRRQRAAKGKRPHPIEYYYDVRFRDDFLAFVGAEVIERHAAHARALRALADYYVSRDEQSPPTPRTKRGRKPTRAADLYVTVMDVDCGWLIRCLRRRGDLSRVPARRTTVVTREVGRRSEMVQLSPMSAELLAAADGTREIAEIVDAFAQKHARVDDVPGREACLAGLELLRQQGLLTLE